MWTRIFQHQTAGIRRSLGLLLVLFILYGTTVEAAHRHGRIVSGANGAASLVEPEHTSSPSGSKTGCSDCLICQLHQNFGTTFTAFRLVDPPQQILVTAAAAVPLDVRSQIAGPTAGRAPPSIS